jgi:hypothetical protein
MKWKLSIVGLIAIASVLAFFLWRGDSSTRTLSDGSRLTLSGVRIGQTNVYTHGTFLSKTIGRFAPSNGISIAGYKLQQPSKVTRHGWFNPAQNVEVLTAQLQLLPGSARADDLLDPPFYRKFRLLIYGDDGFTYVREFEGFKEYDYGIFQYINAPTFPRTSSRLHFRLEERDNGHTRSFRELATFTVKNPRRAKVENWTVDKAPRITLAAGLELEVRELIVRTEPIHPDDIWDHITELVFRVMRRGQMLSNWDLHDTRIRDASGNIDWFLGNVRITNDWAVCTSARVLDPSVPWRFDANFALDSDFPETNLYSFAITWPTGTNWTEFSGLPVSISFVNSAVLAVQIPSKPPHLRLTFVSAFDDEGRNINEGSGSWSQHSFWKLLKVRSNKQMIINATIAIQPNHPASFTLQPRYDKSRTLP